MSRYKCEEIRNDFLTDSAIRDTLVGFLQGRSAVFPDLFTHGDYPPNTLLVIDGLVRDDFLVEISAVAALP